MNNESIAQPVEHPLKASDIGAQEGSPAIVGARADYDAAKAALDRADSQQLFRLYEKTVKDQGEAVEMLLRVVDIYRKDKPPLHLQEAPIQAMERVALAAIDLAKSIALASKGEHGM